MRNSQRRVADFLEEAELYTHPAYRLLDLTAEVGELAAGPGRGVTLATEEPELAVGGGPGGGVGTGAGGIPWGIEARGERPVHRVVDFKPV